MGQQASFFQVHKLFWDALPVLRVTVVARTHFAYNLVDFQFGRDKFQVVFLLQFEPQVVGYIHNFAWISVGGKLYRGVFVVFEYVVGVEFLKYEASLFEPVLVVQYLAVGSAVSFEDFVCFRYSGV